MRLVEAVVSTEMVEKARRDPAAKEKLFLDDIKPLGMSLIYKFDIPQEDVDDIMQEMYLAYERSLSLKGYKPGSTTKFTTYVYRTFRSVISDYFASKGEERDHVKYIREPEEETLMGDRMESLPFLLGLSPEDEYLYRYYREKLEELLVTLPDFERQVLTLMMEGYNISEVAKMLKVSDEKITALVRIPSGRLYQKVKSIIARFLRRCKVAQEPEIDITEEEFGEEFAEGEEEPFAMDETFPGVGDVGEMPGPPGALPPVDMKSPQEVLDAKSKELILNDLKQVRFVYEPKNKKEYLEKLEELGWDTERLFNLFPEKYERFFGGVE